MAGTKRSARMGRRTSGQEVFGFRSWGGARVGAGRKPKGERALVSRRRREALAARFPVHVTLRVREGLPSLRAPHARRAVELAFGAGCERTGFRLVHYRIQRTHLHLIVEAADRGALARGLQGLAVRIARASNRVWNRKGKVFSDRYHARILRSPTEVRNALVYVLRNHVKHGIVLEGLDPCASGRWFDGWRDVRAESEVGAHLARARTWLLRVGWRRWGLVESGERPRATTPRTRRPRRKLDPRRR